LADERDSVTEYYFDVEIGYEDPRIVEMIRRGEQPPANWHELCKIVTIQYRMLRGRTAEAMGDLVILKEWEKSERDIVAEFSGILVEGDKWRFVPVGFNLDFDLGLFMRRANLYGYNYTPWFIHNVVPKKDLQDICLGMNDFEFGKAGLEKFTEKSTSGRMVPVWYADKEYDRVVHYVEEEAAALLSFYRALKTELPKFRKERGFVY
jgi:hypothetical protein